MVPSIFISSTIADLKYVRDALRDAIEDLRYQPVMSERGGVGYLYPESAADACCRAIPNCQMCVLIVGKRYGDLGEDGLSVTHREYRTARDANIPLFTLVEAPVLHYKDVYDASSAEPVWRQFAQMQNPQMTFKLLNEINASATYNAIIPFASVAEAKEALKTQIADFVGQCLAGIFSPLRTQLQEIRAELAAVARPTLQAGGRDSETKQYLAATRYLLHDSVATYRTLLERIFGDMDTAVTKVVSAEQFGDVLKDAGFSVDVVSDESMTGIVREDVFPAGMPKDVDQQAEYAQFGMGGGYIVCRNKHLRISESYYRQFEHQQKALHSKTKVS